jgi:hypothetical protein
VTNSCTSRVSGFAGLVVLGGCVLGTAACGGSSSSSSSPASPSSPTQPVASLRYVSVTGSFAIGSVGGTMQLRANANTSAGAQDVTNQATWTSSNDSIVSVSSGGLVSAKGTGLAVITASYQGISGHGGVSVATAVDITGTWFGTSTNPASNISLRLTQTGDQLSGASTTIGDNGSLTGTLNGGTVVLAGSVAGPSGGTYSSWTDERCALDDANTMRCVNPMTLSGGSFTLMEVTLRR